MNLKFLFFKMFNLSKGLNIGVLLKKILQYTLEHIRLKKINKAE